MSGVELIAAERKRQMEVECWTPEHDDEHDFAELTKAARAYTWVALCEMTIEGTTAKDFNFVPNDWPVEWTDDWFKPSDDPIRNLEKAGALIAAEIDRLERARDKRGTVNSTTAPNLIENTVLEADKSNVIS